MFWIILGIIYVIGGLFCLLWIKFRPTTLFPQLDKIGIVASYVAIVCGVLLLIMQLLLFLGIIE